MRLLEYNIVKLEKTLAFQICDIHQTLVEYMYKHNTFTFKNCSINVEIEKSRRDELGNIFITSDGRLFITLPYLNESKIYDENLLNVFKCEIFKTDKIRDEVFDKVHETFRYLIEKFKLDYPGINDKIITTKTIIEI